MVSISVASPLQGGFFIKGLTPNILMHHGYQEKRGSGFNRPLPDRP